MAPGWTPAAELQPSDRLRSHDGQWVAVEEVIDNGEESLVYNLRVSQDHTYFAGCREWEFSVWAHNVCLIDAADEAIAGLKVVNVAAADKALRNAGRLMDVATEGHHPFFRMFLRAMKETGLWKNEILTAAGKFRPQILDYLERATKQHQMTHAAWDAFVQDIGLPFLQAQRGNAQRLASQLAAGNITPGRIFDLAEQFYSRPDIANGAAWLSVRAFRGRLGF